MSNDTELLRRYVEERAEEAFTELVNEHLALVYAAARRESGEEAGMAEDIAQAVFLELARQGRKLLRHPCLAGWLYTTVRHVAANRRRADQRRRWREQEAQTMQSSLAEASPEQGWAWVRPVLDDALHQLSERDRAAVVLRLLENRPLREVGAALGLEENAARMRVERALEKLRVLLARRGITSTAASLAAAVAVGVATPAPAALGATIASAVLASGLATGSVTLNLLNFMSLTQIKVGLVSALVVAAVGLPAWQQARLQRARAENAQLRAREPELVRLRAEVGRLRQVEADQAELERLRQWQATTRPELLRLRGMAGVARRANAEAEDLRRQLAQPTARGDANPVAGAMADAMQRAMEQQVADRLARLTASLHLTPEQIEAARAILARQGQAMSAGMKQAVTGKFDKEELARLGRAAGNPDQQIQALLTPDQKAAYPSYQEEEAAHNARLAANAELLQLQTTPGLTPEQQDRAFAALYQVTFDQLTGAASPPAGDQAAVWQWTLDQKATALAPILTSSQMEAYRQQQAIQAKLVKDIWSKMQGTAGASAAR